MSRNIRVSLCAYLANMIKTGIRLDTKGLNAVTVYVRRWYLNQFGYCISLFNCVYQTYIFHVYHGAQRRIKAHAVQIYPFLKRQEARGMVFICCTVSCFIYVHAHPMN